MDPISLRCFFGAASAGGGPGLEAYIYNDSENTSGNSSPWASVDNNGNIYVTTSNSPERKYFKISNGSIAWQRRHPTVYTDYGGSIVRLFVSPNGSYVGGVGAGNAVSPGWGPRDVVTCKIDPSTGDITRLFIGQSGLVNNIAGPRDIVVDDDGLCETVGLHYRVLDAPYYEFMRMVVDFSSDSGLVHTGYVNRTYFDSWTGVSRRGTGGSGGIRFVCGVYSGPVGNEYAHVVAYGRRNASILWQRTYYDPSNANGSTNANAPNAVDNAGNAYIKLDNNVQSTNGIAKLNGANGAVLWRKIVRVAGSDNQFVVNSLDTDGTGQLFFLASATYSGVNYRLVGALDLSGNPLWINRIYYTPQINATVFGMQYCPGLDKLLIWMNAPNAFGTGGIFLLPADGSGQGEAGDYVYETFTTAPITFVDSTESYNNTTSSIGNYSAPISVAGVSTTTSSTVSIVYP